MAALSVLLSPDTIPDLPEVKLPQGIRYQDHQGKWQLITDEEINAIERSGPCRQSFCDYACIEDAPLPKPALLKHLLKAMDKRPGVRFDSGQIAEIIDRVTNTVNADQHWSEADVRLLMHMGRRGLSWYRISEALQRTPNACKKRYEKEQSMVSVPKGSVISTVDTLIAKEISERLNADLGLSNAGRQWTMDHKTELIGYVKQGKGRAEIASLMGRTETSITAECDKLYLPRPK
jgi:hypothetical protein